MKAPTPRVIFVRHGQTEWSKSGQYTSVTDLDLTPFGVTQMRNTGKNLIGNTSSQLVKPHNLKAIFTSPRTRAQHTAKLLLENCSTKDIVPIKVSEDLREWEYGDYEGLLTSEIIALRKLRGHEKNGEVWNIWEYGCENGETYVEVTARVDNAIAEIRKLHKEAMDKNEACDVMVVAHGHILRCFAARWVQRPINVNPQFIMDAGGVGVLSYLHHSIDEPALCLAGAFVVPTEEQGDDI